MADAQTGGIDSGRVRQLYDEHRLLIGEPAIGESFVIQPGPDHRTGGIPVCQLSDTTYYKIGKKTLCILLPVFRIQTKPAITILKPDIFRHFEPETETPVRYTEFTPENTVLLHLEGGGLATRIVPTGAHRLGLIIYYRVYKPVIITQPVTLVIRHFSLHGNRFSRTERICLHYWQIIDQRCSYF